LEVAKFTPVLIVEINECAVSIAAAGSDSLAYSAAMQSTMALPTTDSIRTACKRRSGFSVFNTEANRHR
jgi:hypothetical protein